MKSWRNCANDFHLLKKVCLSNCLSYQIFFFEPMLYHVFLMPYHITHFYYNYNKKQLKLCQRDDILIIVNFDKIFKEFSHRELLPIVRKRFCKVQKLEATIFRRILPWKRLPSLRWLSCGYWRLIQTFVSEVTHFLRLLRYLKFNQL